MGEQTPDRTPVDGARELQEDRQRATRRLAMTQLAIGGPAFLLLIFGLVMAYAVAGRPFGGVVFWAVLGTLVVGFAVYVTHALLLLRRSRR